MAPVVAGRITQSTNVNQQELVRTEYSNQIADQESFWKTYVPLMPGDAIYYPSAAAIADQYQFYKFKQVVLDYLAMVGTDARGQIAIGCVATYAEFLAIESWDQVVALPHAYVGPIWTSTSFTASAEFFNQQVKDWQVVLNPSLADYRDVVKAQGFLVVAIQGCASTQTMTIGRMTVTYDLNLSKTRCDPIASASAMWHRSNGYYLDDTEQYLGGKLPHCFSIATVDGGTTSPDYNVSYYGKAPHLLVLARAYDSGAAITGGDITAVSGCSVTAVYTATPSTTSITVFYLITNESIGVGGLNSASPPHSVRAQWMTFECLFGSNTRA